MILVAHCFIFLFYIAQGALNTEGNLAHCDGTPVKEKFYSPEDLLDYGKKRWQRVQYLALILQFISTLKETEMNTEIIIIITR